MNNGLYQGAAALRASEMRMTAISHNLANLGTAGFKRSGTAAHAFRVPATEGPRNGLRTALAVDWSQGNLDRTGSQFDLALMGDGLFAIDAPEGEVYTRTGRFQIDTTGVLQTSEGYPISWEERRGLIDPQGLPIVVDGEGQVRQGENDLGRVRVVNFEDKGSLELNGEGYWRAPAGAKQVAYDAVVHQGALERSNSTGLDEMVAMITVQRAYESATRVMSMINESYQRLTSNR
ncbi:MAG: flagellar hook basal-body protein [Planctomycetota bacterium]